MKKSLLNLGILVISLINYSSIKSQIAYYDAIKLSQLLNSNKTTFDYDKIQSVDSILIKYCYNVKLFNPDRFDRGLYADNPFISPFLERTKEEGSENMYSYKGLKLGDLPKPIGGLDVTNLSQGISLFLIDRAKEELNIAFFRKIKKLFEKHEEISILFPKTSNEIVNILDYNYTKMLPVLQEAFRKDMEALPEGMIQVLLNLKDLEDMKKIPEFLIVLKTFRLMQNIDQKSPPDIIEEFSSIADFNDPGLSSERMKNLNSSLKLSEIISNSVRSMDNKRNWISLKEFNVLVEDESAFKIFLGLIYQEIKNKDVTFNGDRLHEKIKDIKREVLWYSLQISKLLNLAEKLDNTMKEIKQLKNNNKKPTVENIYANLNLTVEIVEFGYEVTKHHFPGTKDNGIEYINLAKETSSLFINSTTGKYSLAIKNSLNIFDLFREVKGKNGKEVFNDKTINIIKTVGTFIGNMADAESPEEVKLAINNAALPVGSSSHKKYHNWNLSINGYLGANWNFAFNDEDNAINSWKQSINVAAPIGFNFSFASLGKGGAFSAFVPLIDVGAIANYQLSSDSATIDQKIYLRNIFSPGAYMVYGFGGNLPLSIGIGGQNGPGLYKIGEDLKQPTWRWNLFLTVDIPIFNITKGRARTK